MLKVTAPLFFKFVSILTSIIQVEAFLNRKPEYYDNR